jgi:hypothetical protein
MLSSFFFPALKYLKGYILTDEWEKELGLL